MSKGKKVLSYKDYIGSVHFNAEDEVFFGKIEGIDGLVLFEWKSVEKLKKTFEESVKDYMSLCKENSKEIEKSYKGSFNVRIAPELHRKAKRKTTLLGISLNQFIQKAVEDELKQEKVL